jgi:hypothetical protein
MEDAGTLRLFLAATTLAVAGVQVAFTAFLAGIIELAQRAPVRPPRG